MCPPALNRVKSSIALIPIDLTLSGMSTTPSPPSDSDSSGLFAGYKVWWIVPQERPDDLVYFCQCHCGHRKDTCRIHCP